MFQQSRLVFRPALVVGLAVVAAMTGAVQAADLALPVHRYGFAADASDSFGGADGTPYGDVTFKDGRAVLGNDGSQNSDSAGLFPDPANPDKRPPGAYIDLPDGIISALGTQATFEMWFTWKGATSVGWQRIFDFGSSNGGENTSDGGWKSRYIFLTPLSGDQTLRFGYNKPGPVERRIEGARLANGSQQHVVVTWDDATTTAKLYVGGALVDEDNAVHFALADIADDNNWLGRCQWADPMLTGSYNEFRIYDCVLTQAQIRDNLLKGPDALVQPDDETDTSARPRYENPAARAILSTADARIDKHRKGDASIVLKNENGDRLRDMAVVVEQQSHEFLFGVHMGLDTTYLDPIDECATRLEKTRELMSCVVLPVHWILYEQSQGKPRYEDIERLAKWAKNNGITPIGFPVVWHEALPRWVLS